MAFSFFPKSVKFDELFLEQHKKLAKAATILDELVEDFSNVEAKVQMINVIEADGDLICRRIAKELSLTFITPFDREDIHELNLAQEEILNLIKAAATRMGLYDLNRMKYPAQRLIHKLRAMVEACGELLKAVTKRTDGSPHLDKIKAIKYECDTLLIVALGETFDTGSGCCESAVILDIIKWTHIYDRIEAAIERTSKLADILEGIMLKHA